jgi:hypothetical protein
MKVLRRKPLSFVMQACTMGHEVSANGIKPDPIKVTAIKKIEAPYQCKISQKLYWNGELL